MKRTWATVALLLATVAGCGRDSYQPASPVEKEPQKTVQVVSYQGRDLFCIEQAVAHGENSYSCDFAAFYAQPPRQGSKLDVAKVTLATMPYRGKTLYCFAYDGGHGTTGYTCDFERFYKENQGAHLPPPESPK